MLKAKSVYSPIDRSKDGLRILATRFQGRGLKRMKYDVWMANLGPSEHLLDAYRSGRLTWAEFGRRYRAELFGETSRDVNNARIKNHGQKFTLRLLSILARRGNVTLMCHCSEDETHCHRRLLKRILKSGV
jgi:uncharacterized protein YeaO (DUF488 family)